MKVDEGAKRVLEMIRALMKEQTECANDPGRRRLLKRTEQDLRRRLATHLHGYTVEDIDEANPFGNGTFIEPYWRVEGVFDRKQHDKALAWMKDRGIEWNGASKSLRFAVRRALKRKEQFPDGHFGLFVERSVRIKEPGHVIGLETNGPYGYSFAILGSKRSRWR